MLQGDHTLGWWPCKLLVAERFPHHSIDVAALYLSSIRKWLLNDQESPHVQVPGWYHQYHLKSDKNLKITCENTMYKSGFHFLINNYQTLINYVL